MHTEASNQNAPPIRNRPSLADTAKLAKPAPGNPPGSLLRRSRSTRFEDRNAQPGADNGPLPRVLVMASDVFSIHALRMRARSAGLAFVFEHAPTAEEFFERLKSRPDIVVCCMAGLRSLVDHGDVSARPEQAGRVLLQRIADLGIAVLLVGGDSEPERETLAELRGTYSGTLRRSQLEWLPMLLERTLRDQEVLQVLSEAEEEAESMAQVLRDSQKLLAVGRLAGSIAHEINNPLEAVTNLLYLIGLDLNLGESTRAYLETAQQELDRVTVISKQTLNFYRETQSPQRVKLSDLLDEVLVLYSRKIEMKKMVVSRRYSGEENVLVFPGEIRQIFSNLVANAIDASPIGGRLSLRVHPGLKWSDQEVRGLRVVVADSGTGMPVEVQRKLGKAFFTTKGQRGTGLGLWVSKAILRRYGGDLQLRSSTAPGRSGTTFAMFLPTNLQPRIVGPSKSSRLQDAMDNMDLRQARPAGDEGNGTGENQSRTIKFRR